MSEELCVKHTCYHRYCDQCVKQACYQYAPPAPAPPPVPMDGVAKQQKMLKEAHPMAPPKQQSKPVPIKPEDEKDEENEEPPKSPPYTHPIVKKKHWNHYRPSMP
ncbi:hypothetical protein PG999_002780 [Apiospora kogelbergensis]|uniref:Uncharacterized protein n=1 Tax=Apiospora kogelbergensis TaxID=1337665 RepID=A0AAW0R9F7_9PEZI